MFATKLTYKNMRTNGLDARRGFLNVFLFLSLLFLIGFEGTCMYTGSTGYSAK
jgi:hypothetical protein